MILAEFAKFLQNNEQEIVEKKSCTSFLALWIKSVLDKKPKTNVEKIIHAEISLSTNKLGDYMLIGKSESGRTLIEALYNFALSFEQHVMTKWIQDKKPSDFK